MQYRDEISMYPDIIDSISGYMKYFDIDYHIFETWHEFNPELRKLYAKEIDILGDFGKPDITVLYKKQNDIRRKVLIIEVKKEKPKLIHIAQAKMYGDIFNADRVFLVSPYELQNKVKQYFNVNPNIFNYSHNRIAKYIQFHDKRLQLQNVFPMEGDLL